jgi:PAS domain S-box-containing protein
MDTVTMSSGISLIDLFFPSEWVKAALVLALFCTWVVIGLFGYLNHYTKRPYFNLWTVAWMFFSVYLAASIGLEESPDAPFLVTARRACIGIAALFMFWGSFRFTGQPRSMRELGSGIVMISIWSYLAAYKIGDHLWITLPVFALLAASSVYTGLLHRRYAKRYRGANLLTFGFVLWGVHLFSFPFETVLAHGFMTVSYFASALLSLYIAMGMIVQVLEQARERNEALLGKFNQGLARRRLLEQEVAVSEQKYRALFDAATDAIFLVNLETLDILEVNEAAQKLTGRSAAELVNCGFQEICPELLLHDASPTGKMKALDAVLKQSGEFHVARPDRTRVTCEGDWSFLHGDKKPVLQVRTREITQRKVMEQQLRQAEKLSALGQLVAGVAHEVNNPLAVIIGYAQILTRQNSLDDKTKREIGKILHESERAGKIVHNLLTFARAGEPQRAPVSLNDLVLTVLEAREYDFAANHVVVRSRLSPNMPRAMLDPNQVEQVLANLIANAFQALMQKPTDRLIEVTTEHSDSQLWITITDNGPGMPTEVMGRIFEPFFTTKPPGKGTGLGLAISFSIIEAHCGKIWADSQPGKGARFSIQLPLMPCPNEPPRPRPVPRGNGNDSSNRTHRLLIVDDEPGIIEVLREVLRGSGNSVDTANNGVEALKLIARSHYDLIISDMRMPDMDGEALYNKLRETHPEISRRVIFLTGDTVSSNTRVFLEQTGNRWLNKPFNVSDVEFVVNDVLRQANAAPSSPQPAAAPAAN